MVSERLRLLCFSCLRILCHLDARNSGRVLNWHTHMHTVLLSVMSVGAWPRQRIELFPRRHHIFDVGVKAIKNHVVLATAAPSSATAVCVSHNEGAPCFSNIGDAHNFLF